MAQKPTQESPTASGTAMSAENKKQPTIQEKKAALREIPSNSKPAEASLLSKDKISSSDSSANKITGTKRPNPNSPASPLTYTYVRRRLETEQGKVNSSSIGKEETNKEQNVQNSQDTQVFQNVQNSQDPQNLRISKDSQNESGVIILQNGSKGEANEATRQQNGSKGEVSEACKPQNGTKGEAREATNEQNGTKGEANEAAKLVSSSSTVSQDRKERFIRLQAFLKNCDQSNQEDYMRMLRALSAVGRSKHAIELEKRAIHLLLEEGKELHRMKVLNVLGKGGASDPSLYPSQLSPPARPQLQR